MSLTSPAHSCSTEANLEVEILLSDRMKHYIKGREDGSIAPPRALSPARPAAKDSLMVSPSASESTTPSPQPPVIRESDDDADAYRYDTDVFEDDSSVADEGETELEEVCGFLENAIHLDEATELHRVRERGGV